MSIRIERLNIKQFQSMKEEWDALVQLSGVNALFLGWSWQYSWWETWGDELGLELLLLAAYENDNLVLICPMYIDVVRVHFGRNAKRVQFIGNAWRKVGTVRTEYLDFIVENRKVALVEETIKYIKHNIDFQEIVICDLLKCSPTYSALEGLAKNESFMFLERETDKGVSIDVKKSFKEYLATLGKNTRLKLYNRRKLLTDSYEVEIGTATEEQFDSYFGQLNQLHSVRWGAPCFDPNSMSFHRSLVGKLGEDSVFLTKICADGEVVSVLYDLKVGSKSYNIQAGYYEDWHKKISLGTLHLGYSIERSFNDNSVVEYDLLIGSGKNNFYKSSFKGENKDFVTLQLVNSPYLRFLYSAWRVAPKTLQKLVSFSLR